MRSTEVLEQPFSDGRVYPSHSVIADVLRFFFIQTFRKNSMPRFAISYQVCTVCIDDDTTFGLQANHFHIEVPKVLAAHGFTDKLKRTMFSYPVEFNLTMGDVESAAKAIYELDTDCQYINHIIVSTIDDGFDLLSKFCNCDADSADDQP